MACSRHILIRFITAIALVVACYSCDNSSHSYLIDEVNDSIKMAEQYIRQFEQEESYENLQLLMGVVESLQLDCPESDIESSKITEILQCKQKADSIRNVVQSIINKASGRIPMPVVKNEDQLVERSIKTAFQAQRGDTLALDISFDSRGAVTLYNADSHQTISSWNKKKRVTEKVAIKNKAIYLLEISPAGTQYVDTHAGLIQKDPSQVHEAGKISADTVEAKRGDWQAIAVNGVEMHNLFEEPRKFTLRGQIKAAFSGTARALVPLQVPKGATDVMYSLRISTNEGNKGTDGEFYRNMSTSYRKIKFLGLPLYESYKGNGLLAMILGDNQPVREEDAYINMYVFFDAGQARRFQNGTPADQLKYSLDYSTMGTQSCNGRIPARGHSTIYLAFENERMRYNNYVWLEAISAVPKTDYYKIKYSIIN